MTIIHTLITIAVVLTHLWSATALLKCVDLYQETNEFEYRHSGWLDIWRLHGSELGLYLIRVSIAATLVMLAMNAWHLFTFHYESVPDVKNIFWRIGNLFMAFCILLLAKEFKYESER